MYYQSKESKSVLKWLMHANISLGPNIVHNSSTKHVQWTTDGGVGSFVTYTA